MCTLDLKGPLITLRPSEPPSHLKRHTRSRAHARAESHAHTPHAEAATTSIVERIGFNVLGWFPPSPLAAVHTWSVMTVTDAGAAMNTTRRLPTEVPFTAGADGGVVPPESNVIANLRTRCPWLRSSRRTRRSTDLYGPRTVLKMVYVHAPPQRMSVNVSVSAKSLVFHTEYRLKFRLKHRLSYLIHIPEDGVRPRSCDWVGRRRGRQGGRNDTARVAAVDPAPEAAVQHLKICGKRRKERNYKPILVMRPRYNT